MPLLVIDLALYPLGTDFFFGLGLQEAIGVLKSPAASEDAKKDSLEALQYLVEPIDNANGK